MLGERRKNERKRIEKGKERVRTEDSMFSFSFENSVEMKTNIGEKIEVSKDTFKMMKNIQKALKMVNNVLNDTLKLQQAIAQDRDCSLVLLSHRIEQVERKVDIILERLFSNGFNG